MNSLLNAVCVSDIITSLFDLEKLCTKSLVLFCCLIFFVSNQHEISNFVYKSRKFLEATRKCFGHKYSFKCFYPSILDALWKRDFFLVCFCPIHHKGQILKTVKPFWKLELIVLSTFVTTNTSCCWWKTWNISNGNACLRKIFATKAQHLSVKLRSAKKQLITSKYDAE